MAKQRPVPPGGRKPANTRDLPATPACPQAAPPGPRRPSSGDPSDPRPIAAPFTRHPARVHQPEPAGRPDPIFESDLAGRPGPTSQTSPANQPGPASQTSPANQPDPTSQTSPADRPGPARQPGTVRRSGSALWPTDAAHSGSTHVAGVDSDRSRSVDAQHQAGAEHTGDSRRLVSGLSDGHRLTAEDDIAVATPPVRASGRPMPGPRRTSPVENAILTAAHPYLSAAEPPGVAPPTLPGAPVAGPALSTATAQALATGRPVAVDMVEHRRPEPRNGPPSADRPARPSAHPTERPGPPNSHPAERPGLANSHPAERLVQARGDNQRAFGPAPSHRPDTIGVAKVPTPRPLPTNPPPANPLPTNPPPAGSPPAGPLPADSTPAGPRPANPITGRPPLPGLQLQPMVHVDDMASAVAFYEKLGGEINHGERDGDWVLMQVGTAQIGLVTRPPDALRGESTVELNFAATMPLDRLERMLRERGVTVVEVIADRDLGMRLHVETPEGMPVKIHQVEPDLMV